MKKENQQEKKEKRQDEQQRRNEKGHKDDQGKKEQDLRAVFRNFATIWMNGDAVHRF